MANPIKMDSFKKNNKRGRLPKTLMCYAWNAGEEGRTARAPRGEFLPRRSTSRPPGPETTKSLLLDSRFRCENTSQMCRHEPRVATCRLKRRPSRQPSLRGLTFPFQAAYKERFSPFSPHTMYQHCRHCES